MLSDEVPINGMCISAVASIAPAAPIVSRCIGHCVLVLNICPQYLLYLALFSNVIQLSPGKVGKCWGKNCGEEAKCIREITGKEVSAPDNCLLTILFTIKDAVFISNLTVCCLD